MRAAVAGGTPSVRFPSTLAGFFVRGPLEKGFGAVSVTTVDDALDEAGETVVVDIVGVLNGQEFGTQQVQATILDDDLPPNVTLEVDTTAISEFLGSATIEAVLSAITSRDVTAGLVLSGAAIVGDDYSVSSSEIFIPAGSLSGAAFIMGIPDALHENDEPIIIDIARTTNAVELGEQHALIAIEDDDPAPTASLSIDSPALAESGSVTLTASLPTTSGLNTTVELGLSGTATVDIDYTLSLQQIVIAAGQLSATTTIRALEDSLLESSETVIVEIAGISNGEVATVQQVVATITDSTAQLATVQGRQFHNRNANGDRDATEEYLDGWTVELLDAQKQVIATQRTREIDLNTSGEIDEETERGLYRFNVAEGEYSLRSVGREG